MSLNGAVQPLPFIIILSLLALLPLLMIICTSFLKISIVLILTRNALGVQQVPPNMALYGIALASTIFIMAPVFNQIFERVLDSSITLEMIEKNGEEILYVIDPLITFMQTNASPDLLQHLMDNGKTMWPKEMHEKINSDNILLIIPAFVLTELQNAFKIGFLIFIPFLVVDMVVSNLLMALGMQMVSPMTIALPLKILLFVMVSGWTRLLDALFYSYM